MARLDGLRSHIRHEAIRNIVWGGPREYCVLCGADLGGQKERWCSRKCHDEFHALAHDVGAVVLELLLDLLEQRRAKK